MMHLPLGRSNEELINLTGKLAARWDATVIGVAGYRRPTAPGLDLDVTGINAAEQVLREQLWTTEREFLGLLASSGINVQWRPVVTSDEFTSHLLKQARSADLFVGAIERVHEVGHQVKIEDIIADLGRPALMIPTELAATDLDTVLIGWTDTRAARRAVSDALPLLRRAKSISICEVGEEVDSGSLNDIRGWLKRNDIFAELTSKFLDGDPASELLIAADDLRAGVVIAGAFSHNRLHERVFGSVTKELLGRAKNCLFLSH
jgi:nucleotide-binding universal stress UspA family protein